MNVLDFFDFQLMLIEINLMPKEYLLIMLDLMIFVAIFLIKHNDDQYFLNKEEQELVLVLKQLKKQK
jgi:hypothetical protein